ncbi:MAG: hypothetical protein ACAI25_10445 [Planctomycetota bacterium]
MKKKLGLGAAVALFVAVVAIGGCGSKTKVVQGSPVGELNDPGFPASAIAINNLASDGGGFSENNQSAAFSFFTCRFNYKHPESDAPSTADDSAMFLFVTSDNGSTGVAGREHVWVSYWSGSRFTPPQEISGEDRDENLARGDLRGTRPSAAVMVPLNTGDYVGTGTATRVRENAGNWVIFWQGNTFTRSSTLDGSSGTAGILQGSAIGQHHTFWATVFLKSLAKQPLATTNRIGNTAASGTPNGPAIECHYGFQYIGTQISPYRNGASAGGATAQAGDTGFVNDNNQFVKPAEDISNFAVATDTFVHCGTFSSLALDLGGLTKGSRLGNLNGGKFVVGPNTPGPAFGPPAVPFDADYEVGDSTTFLQIFWTQLVTSGTGLSRVSTTFAPTGGTGTVQLGPTWQLLTANFNLATMTIGGAATPFLAADSATAAVVSAPATRNTFTDGRRAAVAPTGLLMTYNNILFWTYQDTSLAVAPGGAPGTVEGVIDNNGSTILSTVAVLPGANGEATIGSQNDITLLGTNGRHQTTNDTTNVANGIVVGEEFVNTFTCSGPCALIGPDEGQADIVAFVNGRITTAGTRGGGTLNDTDTELWAVALQATGATAGMLQPFTNNPRRVSAHVPELPFPTSTNTTWGRVADGVIDVKLQSSRDGTYAVLAWRQVQGTSDQANLALLSTVYKVFRSVAAGSSASTPTVPTLDQRFPTAVPLVVNTAITVGYSSQPTNIGSLGGFTGSPVAAYDFQGNIAYKCGFQGDRTKMSILWLYSDGTEDRLFIKLLTVATGATPTDNPTIAATNEAEFDANATVPGRGVRLNPADVSSLKTSFRFLPGSFGELIPTYSAGSALDISSGGVFPGFTLLGNFCSSLAGSIDNLLSVDAGVNTAGAGGDVLIVFSKIVAATDNNWDRQIIAALYDQSSITDRVVISKAGVESSGQAPGAFLPFNFPNGGGLGVATTYDIPVGFKTMLWNILPNTSSSSVSTAARSPDNGTYIYFGGPVSYNASSARALYTRHFRPRRATSTVTFANNFFPAAAASTGDASFRAPIRIDKARNSSDATPFSGVIRKKGRRAVVVFSQDNHLWGTITDDGETYTETGGLGGQPDAYLIDDNTSASLTSGNSVGATFCGPVDRNCDDLSGSMIFILKQDVNLNPRFYVRVMQ